MKETKIDKETIETLPNGWFYPNALSVFIPRRDYRCQRLVELGVLENRITPGESLHHWWKPLQYRKIT